MNKTLLLSMCLSSFTPAFGYLPFLKHSEFLKKTNSQFVITWVKDGKAQLQPMKKEWDGVPKFILGEDGRLHELKGKVSSANGKIFDGCAGDIPGVVLESPVNGDFIYFGTESAKVDWYPAKPATDVVKCLKYKKGFNHEKTDVYDLEGSKQKLFIAEWGRPEPKKGGCSVVQAEQTGFFENGKCTVFNLNEKECDGMEVNKKALSTRYYVGMLKLGENERWLIFRSIGYESGGFSAIPYEPGKKIDFTKAEELHPMGC